MRTPPRKQAGRPTGARRIAGEVLDFATAAATYGGTVKMWRGRVRRQIVPYRRWAGRIVFLRSELDSFFRETLTGCGLEEARANLEARRP